MLRALPAVGALLETPPFPEALAAGLSRREATEAIRDVLRLAREGARRGAPVPHGAALARTALELARRRAAPGPLPVVNATGVVLHTGLGRAVLAPSAREAAALAVAGYAALEVDLETGGRGARDARVAALLTALAGSEAAAIVNNNAGAVVLALHALARGREVILSRGEMVEIGGSFRMPEVMEASGAILREVGTTNRTRLSDYEQAIGKETAAILRVHPSNYRVVGFTERPGIRDLAALARRRRVLLLDDVGSGALLDLAAHGLPGEPLLADEIRAGADVVTASADKLLGGPQGGILLGRRRLVQSMKRDPLYRALRVGKYTLAALEATLKLFRDPATLEARHPTTAMLLARPAGLRARAEALAARIRAAAPGAEAAVRDDASEAGSGALPAVPLPTSVVALSVPGLAAEALARALRLSGPPVFTRIRDGKVLLDPRTILEGQDILVARAVAAVVL